MHEPGAEHEGGRHQLRAADHAGHRLGMDRVRCEQDAGRQGGARGEPESGRQRHHQRRADRVQEDVDEMIPERVEAAEPVIERVAGDDEGPIEIAARREVLPVVGGEDPQSTTVTGHQRIANDDVDVVEDEPMMKRVGVAARGEEHRHEQRMGRAELDPRSAAHLQ